MIQKNKKEKIGVDLAEKLGFVPSQDQEVVIDNIENRSDFFKKYTNPNVISAFNKIIHDKEDTPNTKEAGLINISFLKNMITEIVRKEMKEYYATNEQKK